MTMKSQVGEYTIRTVGFSERGTKYTVAQNGKCVLEATVTVTRKTRTPSAQSLFFPGLTLEKLPVQFRLANVESSAGSYGFSRYDTETDWFCDSHFGPGYFPYFVHGEGSRSCLKSVATGALAALLDAAAAQQLES